MPRKSAAPMHESPITHNRIFEGKRILITGGTGSLGKVLLRRILTGKNGRPAKIWVLSRDEAKQHQMRLSFLKKPVATEEVIYDNFKQMVTFRIGDVRDFSTILSAVSKADIVINAAALKQVPTCEYFPDEAVATNIGGAENITRAVRDYPNNVETVVCVSTDKACMPVNVMGMTKAIQERIFLSAALTCEKARYIAVRYGNVLASRGSVLPLFHEQIKQGGPVTITDAETTRFLLSLDQAVDTIFACVAEGRNGETYIPRVASALITDVADILIGKRKIEKKIVGMRPGEKLHEALISHEEAGRSFRRGNYFVIPSIIPEIHPYDYRHEKRLKKQYSSKDSLLGKHGVEKLLRDNRVTIEDNPTFDD